MSILGFHLGPRMTSWGQLSADFRDFLANCWVTCGLSSLERGRARCWDRFRVSWEPFQDGFWDDFGFFSASLQFVRSVLVSSNFIPSVCKFQIDLLSWLVLAAIVGTVWSLFCFEWCSTRCAAPGAGRLQAICALSSVLLLFFCGRGELAFRFQVFAGSALDKFAAI